MISGRDGQEDDFDQPYTEKKKILGELCSLCPTRRMGPFRLLLVTEKFF